MQHGSTFQEQFLNLKPGRAVDRIFTENRMDEVHSIYASIQENKRTNTHLLRESMEKSYEKMLDCSQLLNKIKDFSAGINDVAEKIEGELERGRKDEDIWAEKDFISVVENQIVKCQFVRAMRMCTDPPGDLLAHEEYYLPYLKTSIVNDLEQYLVAHSLTENIIKEAHQCLDLLVKTNKQQLGDFCEEYDTKSLMGMIGEHMQQREGSVLPIVFRLKLLSLGECGDKDSIQGYFQDLCLLLSQEQNSIRECLSIYEKNIPNIKQQLAEAFVLKQDDGLIIFRRELYDSLLNNSSFLDVLSQFHRLFGEQENPLVYFKELWNNYFLNLVDYLVQQVNPALFITNVQQYRVDPNNIPRQLRIYLYDESVDLSIQSYEKFTEKLQLFSRNLTDTLSRCTEEEIEKLKERFTGQMKKVQESCDVAAKQLENDKTKLSFRRFTILCILCQTFTATIASIDKLNEYRLDQWKSIDLSYFWSVFEQKGRNFQQSMLQYDQFFVGYLQKVPENRQPLLKEIFAYLCVKMLQFLQKQKGQKEMGNIHHTLECLKNKKQKVTIRDKILLPYHAEKVFGCEIKKIEIESSVYRKHFLKKEVHYAEVVEEQEDDFEIGQKETNKEVLKIGKSLMNIGNSFISGFIKK